MKFTFINAVGNDIEIDVQAQMTSVSGRLVTLDAYHTWEQLKLFEQPIAIAVVNKLLRDAHGHAERELAFANDIAGALHSSTANCAGYVRMRRMGLLGDEDYNALYHLHQKLIQPAAVALPSNEASSSPTSNVEAPVALPDALKTRLTKLLGTMDAPRFIRILESSRINPENIHITDSIVSIRLNPLMPVDEANRLIEMLRNKLSDLSQNTESGRIFPAKIIPDQCHIAIDTAAFSEAAYQRAHSQASERRRYDRMHGDVLMRQLFFQLARRQSAFPVATSNHKLQDFLPKQ